MILLSAAAALLLSIAVAAASRQAAARALDAASPAPTITEAAEPDYVRALFDTGRVHAIDVLVPDGDWDSFIETCTDKAYLACDLVIDGELYPEAAIRAKGNSSMQMASHTKKYSFKIEFDHYRAETFHGLDKLNLNNLVMDASCIRDYLVYRMMDEFGVDAPLCSFVFVTVNGEAWGLYLAVEGVEDAFLERNFGAEHGALYKPDNISHHKGDEDSGMFGGAPARGAGPSFEMESDEASSSASVEMPSFEMPRPGGGGGFGMGADDVKLQYIDGDPESYPNIFDSAKTDISRKDKYRLIEALRKLSAWEDLEQTLDTDEVLRYFVSHLFTCNSDSYTGGMIHNYYLYEENGRLSMIPWDYNLAFGQQSITGQLDGTIPSTTEGQRADSSALIDASELSASGEFGGEPGSPSGEASGGAS